MSLRRAPFLAALAAAGAGGARPAAAQAVTVRVATTPIDGGAQPFYAQAMGFFKKAGLNAEITTISNGSAVAAAVASGSLDVGQSNVSSIAAAHERGLPFVIIAPASLYVSRQPQSALVVPKSSAAQSARDLNGKTMAVSGLRTISQVGPMAWIDRNGGNAASLKYLEMPFSAMAEALSSGRVDSALLSEPELGVALTDGTVRVLSYCYDAIGNNFVVGAWFANSPWVQAHPDLARTFASVMFESARWANRNPQQSGKILEQTTSYRITPNTKRVIYGEKLDPAAIQPLIDVSAKYGALKASFPASEIIAKLS